MRKYIWLLALPLLFAACEEDDKDQDLNAPSIDSLAINGKDHDVRLQAGNDMELEVTATDDQGLQEIKVDIHDIFDGHEHGKRALNKWSTVRNIPVSGKEANLKESFMVPGQATAGRYHALVQTLDEAGNEAPFKEINFVVENGQQPTFNVTSPNFSQEVHAPKGSTFGMQGTVEDQQDLAEIRIMIKPAHHDDHDHGDDDGHDHGHSHDDGPLIEKDFDLPGDSDTSFDLSNFSVTIPTDAETGHYHVEMVAKDGEGNYGLFKAEIHIM